MKINSNFKMILADYYNYLGNEVYQVDENHKIHLIGWLYLVDDRCYWEQYEDNCLSLSDIENRVMGYLKSTTQEYFTSPQEILNFMESFKISRPLLLEEVTLVTPAGTYLDCYI